MANDETAVLYKIHTNASKRFRELYAHGMKTILVGLLLLSSNIFAFSKQMCLSDHIKEAMILNKERKSLYAEITNKQSLKVSRSLISLERQMLFFTYPLDLLAKKYQRLGMPIFCRDIISMEETPEFTSQYEQGAPDILDYKKVSAKKIRNDFKRAFRNNNYDELIKVSSQWLHKLEKEPRFNCLTRHFIETIIRSSKLAKEYILFAKSTNLRDPSKLMNSYLRSVFVSFLYSVSIDEKASPIQAAGIPIICNDVPFVPLDI